MQWLWQQIWWCDVAGSVAQNGCCVFVFHFRLCLCGICMFSTFISVSSCSPETYGLTALSNKSVVLSYIVSADTMQCRQITCFCQNVSIQWKTMVFLWPVLSCWLFSSSLSFVYLLTKDPLGPWLSKEANDSDCPGKFMQSSCKSISSKL